MKEEGGDKEEEDEGDEEDTEEEEENNGHAYGGADGRTEGRATERQGGDDRRLELCMPITYAIFIETYYRFLGAEFYQNLSESIRIYQTV